MPLWLQHLLVLLIVVACMAFVARQMVRTLRLKKSKLGSCCAKGCDANGEKQQPTSATPRQRVVFFPADMLRKRR